MGKSTKYSYMEAGAPANTPGSWGAAELSDIMKSSDEGLETRVWTARGNGATYRDSEELVIRFFANRPCFIKVVASTRQFKEIEEAFSNIGEADSRVMTRGLAVKAKDELRAEEMISYTIVE